MSVKKGSCLKRMIIGCGGLVVLFILFGVMIWLGAALNRPEPVERVESNTVQTFDTVSETSLEFPEDKRPKPVRLVLDLAVTQLEVLPGEANGRIEIDSDYDKANYQLTTSVVETDNYMEYRVTFANKRSMVGLLAGSITGDNNVDPGEGNKLKITLPKDLLISLEGSTKMGRYHFDLSSLAVDSVDLDMKMGDFAMRMEEPNQAPMKLFRVKSRMCDNNIYDFQNFGFREAEFEHKMGNVRVRSSGPMMSDAKLHVSGRMGEVRVMIPENARLESTASAFMGGSDFPDSQPSANPKTLALSGGIKLGEMRVIRRSPGSTDGRDLDREVRRDGIDSVLEDLAATFRNNPDSESVNARQVNHLGYRLLRDDLKEEAVRVFRLNLTMHPDFAHGYDSLGFAYRRNGNREKAIESYSRYLELRPGNEHIELILKELREEMDQAGPSSERANLSGSREDEQ